METRHEPPKPDTMFRLRAPLTIGFPDGGAVRIDDWSLRAVYSADLAGRALDGLMLSIPFQGVGIYFPVELEKGEAEGEYLFRNLTGRERETLALFYRNLLSGRMTTTTEMIAALDTPVDLVPMTETASERQAAEARITPRRTRVLFNLAWYLLLFTLVAGFLGSALWGRLAHVPVIAARAGADLREIRAPVSGFVREIPAAVGSAVSAGDPLIRLDDAEALHRLSAAETALEDTRQRLAQAESRRLELMARASGANAAEAREARQQVEADAAALRGELARLEAQIAAHTARNTPEPLLAVQDGTVLSHQVSAFDPVAAGDVLMTVEGNGPRGITAWLDWGQTGRIWPGMAADVRWLRDGRRQQQRGVVETLSTSGQAGELVVVARIALPGLSPEDNRRLLPPGLPVEVTLRPAPLTRWFGGGGE